MCFDYCTFEWSSSVSLFYCGKCQIDMEMVQLENFAAIRIDE